ncbi:MAG: YihY/virulence factor BrkB family protein [Alphaproteobacteria bacterium]|nr:YihY/virulence factor BrkB family protein [Alphaproteobacteria bacterium]
MTDSERPTMLALGMEAVRRLFADEAIPLAGNIAFRSVFSLFPFLIFLTALAGFLGTEDLVERVVNYLLGVAPEELVRPLAPEIRSILTVPRTGLLSLSAALTIWSAMAGVDSVRVGLNRAYDLRDTRSFWLTYLQNVLFVIGAAAGLLIFASLIVFAPVAFAFIDSHAPDLRPSFATFDALRIPVAVLLLTGGLLLCHRILPAKRLNLLEVLPGVLLTVAVWMVLTSVFSYYLVRFNTFASTYASLSGLFAAMFFVYLAALVLIFGGEVNRVLAVHRLTHSANPETDEVKVVEAKEAK